MRKMTFLSQIYEEAVKVGGYLFFAFEEKDNSSISEISFKGAREEQLRYHDTPNMTIVAAANEAAKVRKVLENQRKNPAKVDLSDTNDIPESDPAGEKAEEILLLEVEKLDDAGNDPEKKQRWSHNSTGRAFW